MNKITLEELHQFDQCNLRWWYLRGETPKTNKNGAVSYALAGLSILLTWAILPPVAAIVLTVIVVYLVYPSKPTQDNSEQRIKVREDKTLGISGRFPVYDTGEPIVNEYGITAIGAAHIVEETTGKEVTQVAVALPEEDVIWQTIDDEGKNQLVMLVGEMNNFKSTGTVPNRSHKRRFICGVCAINGTCPQSLYP